MNKNKIIWLDDEIHTGKLRPDKDELASNGFEIVSFKTADDFLAFIKDSTSLGSDYVCIIIDLLIPCGDTLGSQDTRGNRDTGLILLKKLKQNRRFKDLKVVVYTQLTDNQKAKAYCNKHGMLYIEKNDTLPYEFVKGVVEYIKDNSNKTMGN